CEKASAERHRASRKKEYRLKTDHLWVNWASLEVNRCRFKGKEVWMVHYWRLRLCSSTISCNFASCSFRRRRHDPLQSKWCREDIRRRSLDAAAVVPARRGRTHRHEIRMRHGAVRRVHGPPERQGGA